MNNRLKYQKYQLFQVKCHLILKYQKYQKCAIVAENTSCLKYQKYQLQVKHQLFKIPEMCHCGSFK
jgi:hypothetical protein